LTYDFGAVRPATYRLPLKPLLNRGERAVLNIAKSVCAATKTEANFKVRIADTVSIERSGIPDDLYHYALSAHFDVLVSKDNEAFLAIEFDGAGHDARNDLRGVLPIQFKNGGGRPAGETAGKWLD
jgi:hypothetical protein